MKNEIDSDYPQFIKMDLKAKEDYLNFLYDSKSATCFAGCEQGQLYFLAAVIGFVNNTKKKTTRSTDIRLYRTIDIKYKVLIRAIALSESKYDYAILKDGVKVLKLIEEYANGGFRLLYDKIYDKGLDLSIEDDVVKMLKKKE
jgi:hypothetical protein